MTTERSTIVKEWTSSAKSEASSPDTRHLDIPEDFTPNYGEGVDLSALFTKTYIDDLLEGLSINATNSPAPIPQKDEDCQVLIYSAKKIVPAISRQPLKDLTNLPLEARIINSVHEDVEVLGGFRPSILVFEDSSSE